MTRRELRVVLRLVRRLGVPAKLEPHGSESRWDGKALLVVGDGNATEALHELAHVVLAPASRRRRPDFGLGDVLSAEGRVVSAARSEDEEARATVLGILLEAAAGLNWKATLLTFGGADAEGAVARLREELERLDARGLLDRVPGVRGVMPLVLAECACLRASAVEAERLEQTGGDEDDPVELDAEDFVRDEEPLLEDGLVAGRLRLAREP